LGAVVPRVAALLGAAGARLELLEAEVL
jgi:hypothetical protein